MFCQYCGSKLEDDALFCSSCGHRVEDEPARPDVADVQAAEAAPPAPVEPEPPRPEPPAVVPAPVASVPPAVLESSKITYLDFDYVVFKTGSVANSEQVFVKIIDPDGTTMTGNRSPSGYTTSVNVGSRTWGWGRSSPGAYRAGNYTIEFWYNGARVGGKGIYIGR